VLKNNLLLLIINNNLLTMLKKAVLLKGIVHPKMKNISIYSPSSFSKPAWVSFFFWTQKKIFWRMWVTKQLMDPL